MTMVEKMARAMNPECFEPEAERVFGELWVFDKNKNDKRKEMRALALAALEAMIDPDETLVDKGLVPTGSFLDIKGSQLTVNREKMRLRFNAMIKAAIAEHAATAIGNRRA